MTDTNLLKQAREALENIANYPELDALEMKREARATIAAIDAQQAATVRGLTFGGMSAQEFIGAELFAFQEATGCDTADEFLAQQATPPAVQAPTPLTETEIEFGLNNELEDPSDDESHGFHRGVRWAEARHGIGAAAQGGEHE